MGVFQEQIGHFSRFFLESVQGKDVVVVGHSGADGVAAVAVVTKAFKRKDLRFSVKITKALQQDFFQGLSKETVLLLLDFDQEYFEILSSLGLAGIFVIDHHEVSLDVPEQIHVLNPHLLDGTNISSAGIAALFATEIDFENEDLMKYGILGMIGDTLNEETSFFDADLLQKYGVQKRKGLSLYPSTRPIDKVLEYSSQPFISGITGDANGVQDLLDEVGLVKEGGLYKTVVSLTEEEIEKICSAMMLRNPRLQKEELLGHTFLLKWFGKLEDARELSGSINACSKLGQEYAGLQFCLEIPTVKKEVESMHAKYRRILLTSLKTLEESQRFSGNGFVVFHAQNAIQETLIGTVLNILSKSYLYKDETVLVALVYSGDRIKISVRNTERNGRNVRDILKKVVNMLGGDVGGHSAAAGGFIAQEHEAQFLELIKKELELETIKVQ